MWLLHSPPISYLAKWHLGTGTMPDDLMMQRGVETVLHGPLCCVWHLFGADLTESIRDYLFKDVCVVSSLGSKSQGPRAGTVTAWYKRSGLAQRRPLLRQTHQMGRNSAQEAGQRTGWGPASAVALSKEVLYLGPRSRAREHLERDGRLTC